MADERTPIQWQITTYFSRAQPSVSLDHTINSIRKDKRIRAAAKPELILVASKALQGSSRKGVHLKSYAVEHKTAMVQAFCAGGARAVAEYCAKHQLGSPAESTLRGWVNRAISVVQGGVPTKIVVENKRGPSLTLGDKVENWVLEKCRKANQAGLRLTHVNVLYVLHLVYLLVVALLTGLMIYRSYTLMACKIFAVTSPLNTKSWVKSFLRRQRFVSRAVTHSAADLNPKHEALIAEFRKKIAQKIGVRCVPPHLIHHIAISTRLTSGFYI